MNKEDIRKAVIRAVIEAAGLEDEQPELNDDVRPIGGIADFDSYSGVVATTGVCQLLDYDLPLNFNPFIHRSGVRGASIAEIVDAVFDCVGTKVNVHE